METMEVKYKKLHEDAHEPTRGSACAAGYDLYAYPTAPEMASYDGTSAMVVTPGGTRQIGTGISIEIPDGFFGAIFARSGLATKESLRPANCVGVIDSDYRGEIIVALHNDSDEQRVVQSGDRIAQIVIMPYASVEYIEADELTATERDAGGFGSTGA